MKTRLLLLFLGLVMLSDFAFGQKIKHRKNSKPWEFVGGFGATNFLGELGGQKNIGKNGLRDLDFLATRPLFNIGGRHNHNEHFASRAGFYYGRLRGSDKYTTNYARQYRNLSFRSPVIELSVQMEYSPVREKSDNVYVLPDGLKDFIIKIKNKLGKKGEATGEGELTTDIGPMQIYPYVFAGIGGLYFNPKAKYNDKWYALQKLGTEGQGIEPGTKKYRRVTVCVPMGAGIKYKYNKRIAVGLEYGLRKTFTDYMDDVSTDYYDKSKIQSNYGEAAVALSDPSSGVKPGNTKVGEQRGDPSDKDWYMFMNISISMKLMTMKQRIRPKY